MEQRRLRLGDILDDYCPRERRVTNHAVVAMVEEDVKQTRCTTCDSEHAYKGGREPRRRRKGTEALYKEVLADMPEAPVQAAPQTIEDDASAPMALAADTIEAVEDSGRDEEVNEIAADDTSDEAAPQDPAEEGPINRPLIRATLPRPEGQKDARPVPEFTMRHNAGRGGQFRGDRAFRGNPNGNGNGNRAHGRRFRGGHQAAVPGRGSSGQGGFRGAHGQQRHGGKKRPR